MLKLKHKSFALLLLLIVLVSSSCWKRSEKKSSSETENIPVFHTWNSLKERDYGIPVHPSPETRPPPGFFPWAGIVSHHLLAHDYIDSWFSRLADMREVQIFYILSPSHFGLSLEPYSLTDGSWDSGFGLVESDKAKTYKLANFFNVILDTKVFEFEHGVSVFMPYIKKYFPKAKVTAIAYGGESPVNIPIALLLAEAMEKEFDENGKQENFLLISADFSHRGNLEQTQKKDEASRLYLENSAGASWNMANCDNRPGIFVLNQLGKNNLETVILYHTNSWEIANEGADDITSYFFVYFADKN
ncbi:MAG: AmmeMemoRadiSam system protein B [Treponema sp.]|jgi:AmmeMemoRadiSam system protein B|nr:AmmeMemoRadiSam system protein B [Treponema sp.]